MLKPLAWQGLLANRLRSGLTMLGILIGVGAVILLVAVGNGASIKVQNQVQALGSNIVYIYPSSTKAGGVSQASAAVAWCRPSRLQCAAAPGSTRGP